MSTLLVGFDSAWTANNAGAVVGALRCDDGSYRALGPPQAADYRQAEAIIVAWQSRYSPTLSIVSLDQPTIVRNATGQRPVENIVGSPVSLRYGGMQPANTSRVEMFGITAPVWSFLATFGGVPDPSAMMPVATQVLETYPVLSMIALGWTLPDVRATGRLPKYNPERRTTFSLTDWQFVCEQVSRSFRDVGLDEFDRWIANAKVRVPRKADQDGLDACLCLIVALHMVACKDCLMVGDVASGYIVVPYGEGLASELEARCRQTRRLPSEWVRRFQFSLSIPT
jgi:predicted RNase H-like nuclease